MPASVTSSTRLPCSSASTSSGVRADSLPSKYETTRPVVCTPSPWVSRRSRRVSSAATTSARSSSAASRGGASARSPIGVPASTSTPAEEEVAEGVSEPVGWSVVTRPSSQPSCPAHVIRPTRHTHRGSPALGFAQVRSLR